MKKKHKVPPKSDTNQRKAKESSDNIFTLDRPPKKVGKPLRWETPQELEAEMIKYFDTTKFNEWTVTGLALYLNASRRLLLDYEKRSEYTELVQRAKLMVEHSYEISLRKHGRPGDMFALKNFGWKDRYVVGEDDEEEGRFVDLKNVTTDECIRRFNELIDVRKECNRN